MNLSDLKTEPKNLHGEIEGLRRRLHALETTPQKVGADVVSVISSAEADETVDIAANSDTTALLLATPSDGYSHLTRASHSIGIVEKNKSTLDIEYGIPISSNVYDVATGGGSSRAMKYPLWRKTVQASNGVIVNFFILNDSHDLYMTISFDFGASWSTPTALFNLDPVAFESDTHFDCVIDSNDYIHCTFMTGASGQSVYYFRMNPNSSISDWTVNNGTAYLVDNAIALWPGVLYDHVNNRAYVGYLYVTGGTWRYVARYTTDAGVSWSSRITQSLTNNSIKFGRGIMRGNDRVFVIYDVGSPGFWYTVNDGSLKQAFTQQESPLNVGAWCLATDSSTQNIHLVMMFESGGSAVLRHSIYNGISWSSRVDIQDGLDNDAADSMALTRNGDSLYLFTLVEGDPKTIRRRVYSGGTWSAATSITTEDSNVTHMDSPLEVSIPANFSIVVFSKVIDMRCLNVTEEDTGSVSVAIDSSDDDGTETNDSTWDSSTLEVGESTGGATSKDLGLRFNNVNIPQGSTITSSTLRVYGNESSSSETVDVIVKGIKESDAGVISSSDRPSQRDKTTATISWTILDRAINVEQSSADLTTIIQEIVDQASWASGNSLILVLEDDGNTDKDAKFVDFGEFVDDPWYNVLGSKVDVQSWNDLNTSSSVTGVRGFYVIIKNLTSEQITVRLRSKVYAIFQPSI